MLIKAKRLRYIFWHEFDFVINMILSCKFVELLKNVVKNLFFCLKLLAPFVIISDYRNMRFLILNYRLLTTKTMVSVEYKGMEHVWWNKGNLLIDFDFSKQLFKILLKKIPFGLGSIFALVDSSRDNLNFRLIKGTLLKLIIPS